MADMNDATRDERARNPQQQLLPKGRPPEQRRRRNKHFRATAWLPKDLALGRHAVAPPRGERRAFRQAGRLSSPSVSIPRQSRGL